MSHHIWFCPSTSPVISDDDFLHLDAADRPEKQADTKHYSLCVSCLYNRSYSVFIWTKIKNSNNKNKKTLWPRKISKMHLQKEREKLQWRYRFWTKQNNARCRVWTLCAVQCTSTVCSIHPYYFSLCLAAVMYQWRSWRGSRKNKL